MQNLEGFSPAHGDFVVQPLGAAPAAHKGCTTFRRQDRLQASLAALLLAAGGSTRMGSRKQLLEYQGSTLLRRSAQALIEANCKPVVVVLGCEADSMKRELENLAAEPIVNDRWTSGIGSSIKAGMGKLLECSPDVQEIVIALVDQPWVTSRTIQELVRFFKTSGKPICISSYSQTIGPPLVVSRSFFDRLLSLSDERGAKQIWMDHRDSVATFACPEGAIDVDVPDDYTRLQRDAAL